MRRLLLISLATIPLTTGCQFFNRDGNTVVDIVESVESGEALKVPSVPKLEGKGDDNEAFKDPTVAPKPKAVATADLIRSTDPAARAKAVSRSRIDPFASLPILPDPVVIVPEGSDSNANAGARAAGNGAASNNAGGSGGSAGGSAGGSRAASSGRGSGGGAAAVAARSRPAPTPPPVRVQAPNAPLVVPSPIATLPTIPQPIIAPTISVSGVIQLGNEPYAIVRSGNEPERYVKVGDRIGGGSVRVKRIETLAFEPRVILEENGIEVVRPIVSGSEAGGEAGGGNAGTRANARGVAVPVAAIPARPGTLPTLPTAAVLSAPASPSDSAPGFVPNSLLLQPADFNSQAVLPNFKVPVPNWV